MSTAHVKPEGLGLPYASAQFDEHGYHVVCPVCGFKARAEGGTGHATAEDDVTKGASRVYAFHFTTEADAGR